MHQNPTDRLVAGVLLGGLVTAVIVVALIWLGIPSDQHASMAARLALPVGIAAAILFPGPLLKRTVLRARRDVFLLDEDLNAMLLGRAVGVAGGLAIGVTLATQLL
jgi:hypothetical protein